MALRGSRSDSPAPSDHSDAADDLRDGIEQFRRGEYRGALRTFERLHDSDVATAVEALRWSAQANAKLGAHGTAEAQLHQALGRVAELELLQRDKARASIQLRLAACEQRKGNDEEAERLQRAAIASLDRANGSADDGESVSSRTNRQMTLGSAWNNLGITLMRCGQRDGAREAFEKALAIRQALRDQEGYCLAASNLLALEGESSNGQGPSQEFISAMEEHVKTARQLGASAHVLTPLRVNFANCLEAAKAWRIAAKARRELFGLSMPDEELRLVAKCEACKASNPKLRCSRCRQAFFCSDACQRKAWPVHRHECSARDEAAHKAKASHDCPMCLEAMLLNASTSASPVLVLECLHVVHRSCWQSLLEARDGEAQCPICRDPLAMSS
eukprot:TRINITY_DN24517_c0_g1_i1.p1 TRINITY_DN24517_c0_g1~~TRINITY_DN24517_c0_g1_i1.p1  ORF type:complete len:388 (-),score=74.59 TRINITY_DN24517_c0_g1_i1:282-1445(-)